MGLFRGGDRCEAAAFQGRRRSCFLPALTLGSPRPRAQPSRLRRGSSRSWGGQGRPQPASHGDHGAPVVTEHHVPRASLSLEVRVSIWRACSGREAWLQGPERLAHALWGTGRSCECAHGPRTLRDQTAPPVPGVRSLAGTVALWSLREPGARWAGGSPGALTGC